MPKLEGKRAFIYSFNVLGLDTKMYICYGTSMKSEKQAYNKALEMLGQINIIIKSIRLDRYYSHQLTVDRFINAEVYLIPKKNATLRGSQKWKQTMKEFVENTFKYLWEYYRRENSETAFSTDKRRTGWIIQQRKENRIQTAITCNNLWHNLLRLY